MVNRLFALLRSQSGSGNAQRINGAHRRSVWLCAAGLIAWPILSVQPALAASEARPAATARPMIDAHSHYTAADAEVLSPADVVARMDAAGVSRMVVTGTPPELAQQLYRHAPERVLPFLGVYAGALGKATWMHDPQVPQRVRQQLAEGHWVGMGELHLFAHDAHRPVLRSLVDIAVEHDLLLLIHGDIEVIDRIFVLAPRARVLWAHLGTVPEPARVHDTLTRHRDRALWVDTSVRDERIAPGGVLLPEWRALFEHHPRRFVVAVDTFSTQRWHRYGEVVSAIRTWVSALPEALASRLLHDNAAAMLAQRRAVAPPARADQSPPHPRPEPLAEPLPDRRPGEMTRANQWLCCQP